MAQLENSKIGGKIREALKMPPGTFAFELRCAMNEPVSVKCWYYPENLNEDKIAEVFKLYDFKEKENG
jgi:hypothetical protein